MKIISIVGARPQFIKIASLSKKLRKKHKEITIHTGQHYDTEMSQLFFDELKISKPNYNLEVGSGNHGQQTGKMLIEIEKILIKEKPNLVLVYGDTNSTLAGALAASKLHITIGHIEAGLRSFQKTMPEEINRVVTDHISDLFFCPTINAINLLKKEGITKKVYFTGDVMYDSVKQNIKISQNTSGILKRLKVKSKKYILATIHRTINTDNKQNLESIFDAFILSNKKIIIPLHPRTEKFIKRYKLYDKIISAKNIIMIKPLGYLDMLELEENAEKIITDSGGIQKEAYFLKTPCITLRNETEWIETVKDKWNILVGNDKTKILNAIESFETKTAQHNYFGDGNAAKEITNIIDNL
ncbi:MAG: UDP-N-acetylglucosamine 2-epimerase (non-hydrolyzing) [Candidatus Pacebacteria bacterium]|nr:UDP-N-acetylglucosamine 2-epimerase (non-hydrolyzing) [Candidatus Paceibacterota bacterium]